MNSAEFKAFRLHSDSTLKRMTKDDLIDYIHMLYNNWKSFDEQLENVIKNVDELINDTRESNKEIPQKPSKRYYSDSYGNGGRMKRVDIRCPFCSSSFTNGVRTSIGVFATREKDFIETVENQNYCWNCGHRLDWSDSE